MLFLKKFLGIGVCMLCMSTASGMQSIPDQDPAKNYQRLRLIFHEMLEDLNSALYRGQNGETILHILSDLGWSAGTFQWGARYQGQINAQDQDGNTPLHYAERKSHLFTIIALLMLGANPEVKNNTGKIPHDLMPLQPLGQPTRQ